MPKKRKKLYVNMTEAEMLGQAQSIADLFAEHLDDFEAFDASLNEDYALALQAKIEAAYKHPTDENINNEIAELAGNLKEARKACGKHFQDAKYFIEKAFPDNFAVLQTFGYSDYVPMTRNYTKVTNFMHLFADAADKYKTALLAAGYTQPDIDTITTLTTNFNNAMRILYNAKLTRSETTYTRTTLMNDVWRCIQTINAASKRIYRHNPARLRQYRMPAPHPKAAKAK